MSLTVKRQHSDWLWQSPFHAKLLAGHMLGSEPAAWNTMEVEVLVYSSKMNLLSTLEAWLDPAIKPPNRKIQVDQYWWISLSCSWICIATLYSNYFIYQFAGTWKSSDLARLLGLLTCAPSFPFLFCPVWCPRAAGMLSRACTPVAAFFEKGFYMAKKNEELVQACSHVLKDRDQP